MPKPPSATKSSGPCLARISESPSSLTPESAAAGHGGARRPCDGLAVLVVPATPALPTSTLLARARADLVAPNVLSLLHWERLEQGALYATTSRIDCVLSWSWT